MTMIRLCLPYVWMLLTVRSRLVSSPSVLGLYPHSVFEISKRNIAIRYHQLVLQKLTQTMMLIIVRQS